MFRLALASAALLLSTFAHADVGFTMQPDSPIVIQGDLINGQTKIQGPWIEVRFHVANTSPDVITVNGILVEIDSSYQLSAHYKFPIAPLTLQPGEAADFGPFYADHLPASDSFVYQGDAALSGWVGPADQIKSRLDQHFSFKTQ